MNHPPYWKRIGACLIDFFLCNLVLMLLWSIWINTGAPLISLGLLYIGIYVIYATGFLFFTKGLTPGLGLFKVKVVSEDGTAPSLTQTFTRSFVSLFSISFCLIGLAVAFVDSQRRTLHDLASFTKVEALQ
jgi:uncharacterized RDD family membrane protein YckC